MLEILDHIGLFAFALSGVLTASYKKFDAIGGYVIAFTTALGGGTIRDILLHQEIAWTTSASQITIVMIAATIGILFHNLLERWKRTLFLFDTIGIATFTIIGVQKGIEHNHYCLVFGTHNRNIWRNATRCIMQGSSTYF